MRVSTCIDSSTPSSSSGRCIGKSHRENLVWSGNANKSRGPNLLSTISNSSLVEPGMGTGADNSLSIHVSISLTSWSRKDEAVSLLSPVNTPHTQSEPRPPLPPTRHLALLLEQASTMFLSVVRHSLKLEKKGWADIRQMEVRLWFRSGFDPDKVKDIKELFADCK